MFGRLSLGYWLLLALCALVFAISAIVGIMPASFYVHVTLTGSDMSVWIMPVLIWYLFIAVAFIRRKTERPTRALWRLTSYQRGWLLRGTLFVFLSIPVGRSITVIKGAIPRFVPYYADPHLARLDQAILGTDAWRLTHSVIGVPGTIFLDRMYGIWFMVMMATLAWAAFTRDMRFQVRALLSYFLSWFLLGNLLAMALSSVGPCFYTRFYGDRHFEPLMDALSYADSRSALNTLFEVRYLMATFGKEAIGSGISAMPSLHVGIAFLLYLMCRDRFLQRWPRYAAGTYFALVWIASVHLGWHYASDGVVAVLGVGAIWWTCGKFVEWLEARDGRRLHSRETAKMKEFGFPSSPVLKQIRDVGPS